MTARAAFTQASLKRAIQAAQKAGLRVKGIAPDGTVLVYGADEKDRGISSHDKLAADASRWLEVKA